MKDVAYTAATKVADIRGDISFNINQTIRHDYDKLDFHQVLEMERFILLVEKQHEFDHGSDMHTC